MTVAKLRAALRRLDHFGNVGNSAPIYVESPIDNLVELLDRNEGDGDDMSGAVRLTVADLRAAAAMDENPMRTLLKQMMQGWILREQSYVAPPAGDDESDVIVVGEYSRDPVDCMIEACGGDKLRGDLLHLFDYWSNDIQAVAPHYGLALDRDADGKLIIREDIPPPPTPDHWWHEGQWREPERPDAAELAAKPVD